MKVFDPIVMGIDVQKLALFFFLFVFLYSTVGDRSSSAIVSRMALLGYILVPCLPSFLQ